MKVYNEVRINISTGETIYEDSYEYNGEVAECKGGSKVSYTQSPEQQQVFRQLMPLVQMLSQAGQGGTSPWQIPSIEGLMPQKGWYEGMDQNIMQGIREPYIDASKQLTESLGYGAGSARGGASGVLGGSQADFWSKAGTQMGQQAWGMVSPIQQMGWQAELQGRQFPFTAMPGMMGGTYSQPVVQAGSTKGSDMMSMLGMAGMGLMSNPALLASDIRLKKNVNKIGKHKGMDIIEFEYIWGGGRQVGLIAQQVREVIPNAVGADKHGYLYVNYALV